MYVSSYELTDEQIKLVDAMAEWSEFAACTGHPLFLVAGDSIRRDIQLQKLVCHECPVRMKCLNHALEFPEKGGVWGGMGPKELASYRRELERYRRNQ